MPRPGALFNTLWDGGTTRRRRVLTGASFLPALFGAHHVAAGGRGHTVRACHARWHRCVGADGRPAILLIGHTDPVGGAETNMVLSRRRAAALQGAGEVQPEGLGLRTADRHAQHLAPAIGVDADRDGHGDGDDPPGLADLHIGRVEPGIGPVALDGAGEEVADALVDLGAEAGDLAAADALHAHGADQVAHRAGARRLPSFRRSASLRGDRRGNSGHDSIGHRARHAARGSQAARRGRWAIPG